MGKHSVILYLFFIYTVIKAQIDYCALPCDGVTHTVCRRKNVNCGASLKCVDFEQINFTDDDIRTIVDGHNSLRNKVATGQETIRNQPSAANMNVLTYNKEIAYIAQCLTNSCKYGHDTCRRTENDNWIGQNIELVQFKGTLGDYKSIINSSIYSWYTEVKDFDGSWVFSFNTHGKEVGHYTQLVWATTKEIGCGMTTYLENGWKTYYMACNYGPGGNFLGMPVYKTGSPASDCSGQPVNKKYPGLCG